MKKKGASRNMGNEPKKYFPDSRLQGLKKEKIYLCCKHIQSDLVCFVVNFWFFFFTLFLFFFCVIFYTFFLVAFAFVLHFFLLLLFLSHFFHTFFWVGFAFFLLFLLFLRFPVEACKKIIRLKFGKRLSHKGVFICLTMLVHVLFYH